MPLCRQSARSLDHISASGTPCLYGCHMQCMRQVTDASAKDACHHRNNTQSVVACSPNRTQSCQIHAEIARSSAQVPPGPAVLFPVHSLLSPSVQTMLKMFSDCNSDEASARWNTLQRAVAWQVVQTQTTCSRSSNACKSRLRLILAHWPPCHRNMGKTVHFTQKHATA